MRHFQPHWRVCEEHFIWCETFWLPSVDRTWPPLVSQCPAPWTIKSFHSCKQLVKEGVLAIKASQVEQKEKDWLLAFQRRDKDFNVVELGVIITILIAVILILMIIFQGRQSDPLDISITMAGQAGRVSKTFLEGLQHLSILIIMIIIILNIMITAAINVSCQHKKTHHHIH